MDERVRETSPPGAEEERKRPSLVAEVFTRLLKEKPLGTVGAIIVLMLLLTGIFADLLAPYGFNELHPGESLTPPSAKYMLGTDNVGRDLLSRVIFGARISMIVGVSAAFLATLLSAIIGTISGYFGGRFDLVVQRFVDAWMCFPGLALSLTVMTLLGPGLLQVIIVLSMMYGISGSRIVRGAVMSIKENVYVEAARAVGCSPARILYKHILPNVMAPIIVLFTTRMGHVILVEASLSFLGFGIPPPTPSWGGMLSGSGRRYMLLAPWMVIWPGLSLSIVVYGINMFGDALRDILDPRLRGGLGRYRVVKGKKQGRSSKSLTTSG